MGGSGGSGFFHSAEKPKELARKVRADEISSAEYEVFRGEIAGLMGMALANHNNRPSEAINTHLEEIRRAIESDIEGTVNLKFGGSVAKHTYVNGLSDVDALVTVNKSELAGKSPEEVKDYLLAKLQERFPNTEVTKGTLAVTLKFSDIEVQLLPAMRTKEGYRIPNATGTRWKTIDPEAFLKTLNEANAKLGGKLVPTIKLAKAVIDALPEERQTSGYHTETLAIDVLKTFTGDPNTKDMLVHFFSHAKERILKPMRDITGQSENVDAELGPEGSLNRRLVADAFGRIERRMKNADGPVKGAVGRDSWTS
jgi:hypothetical protein